MGKDGFTLVRDQLPAYLDDDGNPLARQTGALAVNQSRITSATQPDSPAPVDSTPSPDLSSNTGRTGPLIARNDPGAANAAPSQSAPSGDPAQWLQTALSGGMSPQAAIDALNNAGGAYAGLAAVYYPDTNTIGLNNGTYIALGSGGPRVIQRGNESATPATPTAAAAPSASASPVVPPNGNPQGYVPTPAGMDPALKAIIMSRLAADQQPVDANDLTIAAPYQAASDAASRESDQERTAEAEREYAQGGLNTNALNQTIQQSAERNATSLGTLRGTLVQQAYASKQQDLQTLLNQAVTAGDTDSAQKIQAAIANLQAQLTREGYGVTLATNAAGQNANTVNAAL